MMAAVEYRKGASVHIWRFDRFEYTILVLSLLFILFLIGIPYVLKLSIVSTDSMDSETSLALVPVPVETCVVKGSLRLFSL